MRPPRLLALALLPVLLPAARGAGVGRGGAEREAPVLVQGSPELHQRVYEQAVEGPHIPAQNTDCPFPPCSEQVHLALGGPSEMLVIFVTANQTTKSEVTYWTDSTSQSTVSGFGNAYSQLMFITGELLDPSMGAPGATDQQILDLQNTTSWAARAPFSPYGRGSSYNNPTEVDKGLGSYKNPQMVYTSPVIHTVSLSGLNPGTKYYYSVAGDSRNFSFVMPPNADGSASAYPYTIGLTADLGQTDISARTVNKLTSILQDEPGSIMLLSGDLSYADGYFPRWDTWGRFMEPLASNIPILTVGGNHEYGDGEAWVSYNARYPQPSQQSQSVSNLWWSRDVGPVHVIGLCSYAGTDPSSLQYKWLEADLASIDRGVTPWVIVMMHAPWYNSNSGHRAEAELMRQDMEPLVVRYGVDIILNGHVHAYERIKNVYDGCVTPCGPVYLNLGNGGNREGAYVPWLFPKPYYSAFRASTFGPGRLTIVNATHAYYNFTRVGCQDTNAANSHQDLNGADCVTINPDDGPDNSRNASEVIDATWIVRPSNRLAGCARPVCSQPAVPPSLAPTFSPTTAAPQQQSESNSGDDDAKLSAGSAVGVGILALLVGSVFGGVGGYKYASRKVDSGRHSSSDEPAPSVLDAKDPATGEELGNVVASEM